MTAFRYIRHRLQVDRRTFLVGSAAASLIAGLPRSGHAAAIHRRKSLQGPNVGKDLETYATAVEKMLRLKPEDPRNWYRNALTHVLDCPHGNWWFLVWHRGYLGYFEQICRELTGEPDFALPYWDWTKETKVPDAFWDGVLNPAASDYIASMADFDTAMRPVAEAQWKNFSTKQMQQQMTRGATINPLIRYNDFDSFWKSVQLHFSGALQGRSGSKSAPNLDVSATAAVAESKIIDSLAPDFFTKGRTNPGFESGTTSNHHQGTQQSTVEQEPHNLVHNSVGGLMSLWLSPADPIFFMHHANIDRLWDVWSRKQKANGLSEQPESSDKSAYESQEFLFFHDAKGNPVTLTEAKNYASMTAFDYEYEEGTGESQVPVLVASGIVESASLPVTVAFDIAQPGTASVALGGPLADRLNKAEDERFFIDVEIETPEDVRDLDFLVFVGPEGGPLNEDLTGPNFAGAISFFGFTHGHRQSTHRLGITDTIRKLQATGQLVADGALEVAVVPRQREGTTALSSSAKGALRSAVIGSF